MIHGFCYASQDAYACCIYVGRPHKVHSLVYTRHHNTPRKNPQTIPRNETNGMVMCVETMDMVMEVLKHYNPRVELWCDSQVALAWVQNVVHHDKWPTYVRNRVQKIARSDYPVSSWNYVDTKENPADMATRRWKGRTTKTVLECLNPSQHIFWYNVQETLVYVAFSGYFYILTFRTLGLSPKNTIYQELLKVKYKHKISYTFIMQY